MINSIAIMALLLLYTG